MRAIVYTTSDLAWAVKRAKELTKSTGEQHYADSYELTDTQIRQSNPHTIERHFVYKLIKEI